jgi:hypothetical protein
VNWKKPEDRRAYMREYAKRWNKRRKEKGLCLTCSKPAERGRCFCMQCHDRRDSRQKERRAVREAAGLCVNCPAEWDQGGECDGCKRVARSKRVAKRLAVYEAYGGAFCRCCGEEELAFLSLDHVNSDGADERRRLGRGVLNRLIREGFPPGYQVLCHNCNLGRHINGGVCPHQSVSATMLRAERGGR